MIKQYNNKQTVIEKINQRERQLYLHSYLYYECNTNIIEDNVFDKYMADLAELIDTYPQEFKQSTFYEDFKNWEEGSGAFLNYNNPSTIKVAQRVYHIS